MPSSDQNDEFIRGTIRVLEKRGVSRRDIALALARGIAALSKDDEAELARDACHEILNTVGANGMGGCLLCCS